MIRDLLSDFAAKGVRINDSSRLHRYASLFEASVTAEGNEAMHARLDAALLESLQFEPIRRSMNSLTDVSPLLRALADALGGNLDSSKDGADCKARSTQFELFLWACLRAAGCDVTLAEPDILYRSEAGKILAIAAKRPKSERKIIKNIRSGCHQIEKSNADGFIAVDLTFVESLRKPFFLRNMSQYQVLPRIVLDGFVYEQQQAICNAVRGAGVIGVLFHYSTVIRTIQDPARVVSRRWVFLQTREPPIDEAAFSLIQRFQKLLQPF